MIMILTEITFGVMLATAFLVGCGIGELEIMWKEREGRMHWRGVRVLTFYMVL